MQYFSYYWSRICLLGNLKIPLCAVEIQSYMKIRVVIAHFSETPKVFLKINARSGNKNIVAVSVEILWVGIMQPKVGLLILSLQTTLPWLLTAATAAPRNFMVNWMTLASFMTALWRRIPGLATASLVVAPQVLGLKCNSVHHRFWDCCYWQKKHGVYIVLKSICVLLSLHHFLAFAILATPFLASMKLNRISLQATS